MPCVYNCHAVYGSLCLFVILVVSHSSPDGRRLKPSIGLMHHGSGFARSMILNRGNSTNIIWASHEHRGFSNHRQLDFFFNSLFRRYHCVLIISHPNLWIQPASSRWTNLNYMEYITRTLYSVPRAFSIYCLRSRETGLCEREHTLYMWRHLALAKTIPLWGRVCQKQCPNSISRCRLTSIGNPIVEIRRS